MQPLETWRSLANTQTHLSGVECQPFDRASVIHQFHQWATELEIPLYLSNPGYADLQAVIVTQSHCFQVQPTDHLQPESECLAWLSAAPIPGIFLVEGVDLEQCAYTLCNLFAALRWAEVPCYVVLLAEQLEVPISLSGMIPILTVGRPTPQQVDAHISAFCQVRGWQDADAALLRAAQGLSMGEIEWVLSREAAQCRHLQQLAERVLSYKIHKLRGRGLEFIGAPDVPIAAGIDRLAARLERMAALLHPAATQHNLTFPKGIVLWGLPGTGKSLSAKLAAKLLGVPLLATDWNGLQGATPQESLQNLRFLLDTADNMAPCILYFDDFDKGFAGWETDAIARQKAQRFLTWMQEHRTPVLVMATVNRLGMLPVELQRRLPDVFFFDLPHDGARYEIFRLHLAKYFPAFQTDQATGDPVFSDEQWRELLIEYRLCIPDEIGNAVKRVAEEAFYHNLQAGYPERPLTVTIDQLLHERQRFVPVMVREEGAMLSIRNNATYAKSVSSPDQSRFARPTLELFETDLEQAG